MQRRFPVTDQVPRLEQYKQDHPDIEIRSPQRHSALWSAHRDGVVLCAEYHLEHLLDRLDWLEEQS